MAEKAPKYQWNKQREVALSGDGQVVPDKKLVVTPLSDGTAELELEVSSTRYAASRTVTIDLTREQIQYLFATLKPRKVLYEEAKAAPHKRLYGLSCGYWSRTPSAIDRHLHKCHWGDVRVHDVPEDTYAGEAFNRCKGRNKIS